MCGVSCDYKRTTETFMISLINLFSSDHILKIHTLRKHTTQAEMKYRCSICPYATIENAALKKHIRFKHTHDVRNPIFFLVKKLLLEMCTYTNILSDFRDHFYAIFVDSVHILKVL